MSCDMSSITDSASFWASRLFDVGSSGRPYSYANETSSYEEGGGGGYHESVWVVTDSTVSDGLCFGKQAGCSVCTASAL